jgi:hypothetical protein
MNFHYSENMPNNVSPLGAITEWIPLSLPRREKLEGQKATAGGIR